MKVVSQTEDTTIVRYETEGMGEFDKYFIEVQVLKKENAIKLYYCKKGKTQKEFLGQVGGVITGDPLSYRNLWEGAMNLMATEARLKELMKKF